MVEVSTPDDADLFRVVLLNEFAKGAKVEEIRRKVSERFKLNDHHTARVFAGRPVIVKKNVDAETAFRFKQILDEMGALSRIELMPEVEDTDAAGYVERRDDERRKKMDRRNRMRGEHIVPDRRQKERRQTTPGNER